MGKSVVFKSYAFNCNHKTNDLSVRKLSQYILKIVCNFLLDGLKEYNRAKKYTLKHLNFYLVIPRFHLTVLTTRNETLRL